MIDVHDEVAIGYSNIPEINYGFGAQINWKGLDLGVFFRGQAHVSYYLGGAFFPFYRGVKQGNLFAKALDRWSEENPNPNAFYPRLTKEANTNNQKTSTKTIYDGSLIRLSDVEAGYTFKTDWLKKCGCQALRVYWAATSGCIQNGICGILRPVHRTEVHILLPANTILAYDSHSNIEDNEQIHNIIRISSASPVRLFFSGQDA